jgi:uncharacterized protein (TIGR02145 family)
LSQGQSITCAQSTNEEKDELPASEIKNDCPGRFTDPRNNKIYSTVRIGNQCWMAENLNIGKSITKQASDNGQIEKYCFDYNPNNCELHGGLYTWDELMNWSDDKTGICPSGWHLPDDDEWAELEASLGMKTESQKHLNWRGKSVGSKLLAGKNSGFETILSGYRSDEGLFLAISELALYWTSSLKSPGLAWYRKFSKEETRVFRHYFSTLNACSVRCIKGYTKNNTTQ